MDAETVVANLNEPIFALDAGGDITFVNERFLQVYRCSQSSALGSDYTFFEEFVEEGFEELSEAIARVIHTEATALTVELLVSHPRSAPVPRQLRAEARVNTFDRTGDDGVLISLRDVTELKEYEQELKQSNEKLDQFASVVTHDLRNPLNVAQGHVQLAQAESESEHLTAIEDAHERMQDLIDDLLKLARAGQSVEEVERVRLADAANEAWDHTDSGECEFDLLVPLDCTVQADRDRLLDVLENLFRNATDHNDSPITVSVGPIDEREQSPDDNSVTGFYVEDDGDGVPPDEREKIFEHGYTTSRDGTGFGLSIVGDIVEAHGWSIQVTERTDGGARFEITAIETPS